MPKKRGYTKEDIKRIKEMDPWKAYQEGLKMTAKTREGMKEKKKKPVTIIVGAGVGRPTGKPKEMSRKHVLAEYKKRVGRTKKKKKRS